MRWRLTVAGHGGCVRVGVGLLLGGEGGEVEAGSVAPKFTLDKCPPPPPHCVWVCPRGARIVHIYW